MALSLVTAPTTEPLTVAEAKLHLHVDGTDEDTYIGNLIAAARNRAETVQRRALMTQTWRLSFDGFSYGCGRGPHYTIDLPLPPLQSVSSITYLDTSNVSQTLSSSLYVVDIYSEPGRIAVAYGQVWPPILNQINALNITFACGYTSAALVPQDTKFGMLMLIEQAFKYRSPIVDGMFSTIPDAVNNLLRNGRWGSYA